MSNENTHAASPFDAAIEQAIKGLFASGKIKINIPSETVCQIVRSNIQFASADDVARAVDALKNSVEAAVKNATEAAAEARAAKRGTGAVDAGAVRQIADAALRETYGALFGERAAAVTAGDAEAVQLPPILPVDPRYVHNSTGEKLIQLLDMGLHVMLSGPAGSSKSFPSEQVFRMRGQRYEFVSCSRATTYETLVCYRDLVPDGKGGTRTVFRDGPVARSIRHDFPIILDEIDNADAEEMAALREILISGRVRLVTGEMLQAGPNWRAAMTCNTLRDDSGLYSGNKPDAALMDRVAFIAADYLSEKEEVGILRASGIAAADARTLSKLFRALRAAFDKGEIRLAPSTRRAWRVACMMQGKHPDTLAAVATPLALADAMAAALLDGLPPGEKAVAVAILKQGI